MDDNGSVYFLWMRLRVKFWSQGQPFDALSSAWRSSDQSMPRNAYENERAGRRYAAPIFVE